VQGDGIRAVTLDLDDTLWPFAPIAANVEAAIVGFLREHAPSTAEGYDAQAAMAVFATVKAERADLAHDLGATRVEAMRRMLLAAGDDPALAEPAFELAYEVRQQVRLYPDVPAALDRIAARFPILAITNGNADVERIGIGRWLRGVVASQDLRIAKPDARIFAAACARLGLPAGAVLHAGDDLHTDVGGALAAGLRAAWVHRDLEGDAPPGVLRARDMTELADRLDEA
jgi:putative hydrolase of the HAD superfamily